MNFTKDQIVVSELESVTLYDQEIYWKELGEIKVTKRR